MNKKETAGEVQSVRRMNITNIGKSYMNKKETAGEVQSLVL